MEQIHPIFDIGILALFAASVCALLRLKRNNAYIWPQVWPRRQLTDSQHLQSLFDNNSDAIFSLDESGIVVGANPAVAAITGRPSSDYMNRTLAEAAQINEAKALELLSRTLAGVPQRFDVALVKPWGEKAVLSFHLVPITVGERTVGAYCLARDMTENKRAEKRLHQLAYFDELTGLPNRRSFMEVAERELAAQDSPGVLMIYCLNLDRFKSLSHLAGNATGDKVLRSFADRFRETARGAWDRAAVSRLGGDDFSCLVRLPDADAAPFVAQRLIGLDQAFMIDGREYHLTASVGYASYPIHGGDAETLLKKAQTALDHAKRQGGNRGQMYDETIDAAIQRKLDIETGLRKAIERGELTVHYQPQVEIESGRMVGAEALVRWERPGGGVVLPGEFIPVAEETGLIKPIGEWVLREACRQAKQWQEAGFPALTVSVNLSNRQFEEQHLPETVRSVLDEYGLAPGCLELEITESMAMDAARAIPALTNLKKLGIQISIDDFGTGYSSLSYLKCFPIDKIKIDKTFVHDLDGSDEEGSAIVSAIVAVAHHLKLKVIAEGVENINQLHYLRQQKCDQLQGYYFSPPLPPGDFERLWRKFQEQVV